MRLNPSSFQKCATHCYALILGCCNDRRLEQLPDGAGGGRCHAHWPRFRCGVHQSFARPLDDGAGGARGRIPDAAVRRGNYFNDCAYSAAAARCSRDGDPGSRVRAVAGSDRDSASIPEQQDGHPRVWGITRILQTQLANIPFIVAGILLLRGSSTGLYWLAPGCIFSLAVGVASAWVLLVEILR